MTDAGTTVPTVSKGDLENRHYAEPRQPYSVGSNGARRGVLTADPSPRPGTETLPVAIIDSHFLTRECLGNNVRELFDGAEVVLFLSVTEFCEQNSSHFGLIVLYVHAAEFQPLELLKSLRSAPTQAIIFMISDLEYQTNPEFIRAAWRLGVRGFVSTKTTSLLLALSAIRFVQAGGFFAPVDTLLSRSPVYQAAPPLTSAPCELTARESVVLGLLKEGKTNKVIARELQLSSNTVKVHVHNILHKMQAGNRTEAASRIVPDVTRADQTAHMQS